MKYNKFTLKSIFLWDCKFDINCIIENNTVDKNIGISTKFHHKYQSATIGWRVKNNLIQVFTIQYEKGKLLDEIILGEVYPNQWFQTGIIINDFYFTWIFKTNLGEKSLTTSKSKSWKLKYLIDNNCSNYFNFI